MKNEVKEVDTGVLLPEDGIVDVTWARKQLERSDAFSKELMYFGKGSVFFLLQTNLSIEGFEQAVRSLEYSVEQAELYISYLQKRPVLTAIKNKYYVALALSAAEFIPNSIDEALALCDITVAKYGALTAKNLEKALGDTGKSIKKMSEAAISVEAMKKKAFHEWALSEYGLSDDDILNAQRVDTSGKSEYLEKSLQAFSLLGDWKTFYAIIAEPVHASGDTKALRFLADINDAAASIQEFLAIEAANHNLIQIKEKFNSEVYPELSFKASKEDAK